MLSIRPLKAAGADRVFSEKISGAKTNRKQLAKGIEALVAGDVLLVTRLDRLARSTRDLLNVLATVSERKAGFRSLSDRSAARASRRWELTAELPQLGLARLTMRPLPFVVFDRREDRFDGGSSGSCSGYWKDIEGRRGGRDLQEPKA